MNCWCTLSKSEGSTSPASCGSATCTPAFAFDQAIAAMNPSYLRDALIALRGLIGRTKNGTSGEHAATLPEITSP